MDTGTPRFAEDVRRGDPVALTHWLVSIPSVNPVLEDGGAGETEIASACAELLEDWGFDTSLTEPDQFILHNNEN